MSDRDEPSSSLTRPRGGPPAGDPGRSAGPAAAGHGAVPELVHAAGCRPRSIGAPDRRGHVDRAG